MIGKFHNKNSLWWLVGMGVLITGFLVFALVVPNLSEPGSTEPQVNVPSMQNVPPKSAPNLQLEIDDR